MSDVSDAIEYARRSVDGTRRRVTFELPSDGEHIRVEYERAGRRRPAGCEPIEGRRIEAPAVECDIEP